MPDPWPLPRGFRFSGVVSGLRTEPNRRDLAVIASDTPAAAAGVFTQNRVCAAPVQVSRAKLPRADARAVVVCSGNANACTGEQGLADAERMCHLTADALGCLPGQVLVASTGVIGRPLPMPVLEVGIPKAVAALSPGGLSDAAHAILTTDTRIKVAARRAGDHTVTGFAKGAAMIGPNLATMLGFILTDAPINPAHLQRMLRAAADESFNCVSVEGHTSTNDTVFALANGTGPYLNDGELSEVDAAIRAACLELSQAIVADAEGANHTIVITVHNCRSVDDARRIARAVADSALVKAAVYGADPNWGRVVSAAGYSGVAFDEQELSLTMGPFELYRHGRPQPFDAGAASAYIRDNREVHFALELNRGVAHATFYTSDLTPEYVRLNADYTT
jgi:glutamate N-acetyltransferase/amino-acid N-acetyltransferase